MSEVPIIVAEGCYGESWRGVLVEDSFKHPAKFAPGLIRYVLKFGIERGYWKPGDRIGDAFGGVACGGIVAQDCGLEWIGVELEAKFVEIGNRNIDRFANKTILGLPRPCLVQGDSRNFAQIVHGVVTSPPFGMTRGGHGGIALEGYVPAKGGRKDERAMIERSYLAADGDRADANIEVLAEGSLASVVAGVVTSPPWETNTEGAVGKHKFKDPEAFQKARRGNGASDKARRAQLERDAEKSYGTSEGQIGREAGETYWQAMHKVYTSCFAAIRPGGYMAVVVKDYVKKKARVPLCDDTMRLLAHVGFLATVRIHAMLCETTHEDGLFGTVSTTVERKSFFRRVQEAKGSPRIDFEEVLIVRKPPTT